MSEFIAAIERIAGDESIQVAVLRGEGERAFIGGADIREMAILDPASARDFITQVHQCCQALHDCPAPVIARLNGYTLGAGLEVAASCDLRVASETAQFGMPEVKLGIPSVVEAAILPKLIGWGRARRLLMLGERIDAREAESWGLVEKVVAEDQLDSAINQWIESILQNGRAVRLQKKLMREWEDLPLSAAIEAGIGAFESAFESEEPSRKMRDFLLRRE